MRTKRIGKKIWSCRLLYLMFLPAAAYFIVLKYVPMFGLMIAFKDYSPFMGVLESPWVGLKHFQETLADPYFYMLLRNTVLLAVYSMVFGMPVPVIFALFLNEMRFRRLKKLVQSISFFPYFISAAVAVGILYTLLSPQSGFVNVIRDRFFDADPIAFLSEPKYFRGLYVGLEIWRSFGYSAIIYLAAMASIDTTIYEAAEVDGAGRWRKMWHITLPGVRPTMMILLIMSAGSILSVSLDTVLLMYNPSVLDVADVIQTYVYRRGLGVSMSVGAVAFPNYSFATAVGLFQSVVSFLLIMGTNWISKRMTDTRLF